MCLSQTGCEVTDLSPHSDEDDDGDDGDDHQCQDRGQNSHLRKQRWTEKTKVDKLCSQNLYLKHMKY